MSGYTRRERCWHYGRSRPAELEFITVGVSN
ncbi:hypothetical protein LMG27952_02281 [Paraburkholderia hiiakae]|uniref:Uncharacterized protein n=1 Tax=Paraburkholderia hiiakae TaxID=1081782 RepID=A0ABN7HRU9_9BURK|nr:hypothetical protein LMG27952_02281 [Paraburkholderia hiiakae]